MSPPPFTGEGPAKPGERVPGRKKNERVFVGLGGNIGPRRSYLRRAVAALDRIPRTRLVTVSPLYETSAVGPRQKDFLNMVAELRSRLSPEELLTEFKKIENILGRQPRGRWGPREIDLDLLFVGRQRRRGRLLLPHPRWKERKFVLWPLSDVAPRFRDPVGGLSMARVRRLFIDPSQRIRRVKSLGGRLFPLIPASFLVTLFMS